jgi:hypothetical protein
VRKSVSIGTRQPGIAKIDILTHAEAIGNNFGEQTITNLPVLLIRVTLVSIELFLSEIEVIKHAGVLVRRHDFRIEMAWLVDDLGWVKWAFIGVFLFSFVDLLVPTVLEPLAAPDAAISGAMCSLDMISVHTSSAR